MVSLRLLARCRQVPAAIGIGDIFMASASLARKLAAAGAAAVVEAVDEACERRAVAAKGPGRGRKAYHVPPEDKALASAEDKWL